jgi:hypothetical protein
MRSECYCACSPSKISQALESRVKDPPELTLKLVLFVHASKSALWRAGRRWIMFDQLVKVFRNYLLLLQYNPK